jgi:hypothetical protein
MPREPQEREIKKGSAYSLRNFLGNSLCGNPVSRKGREEVTQRAQQFLQLE